MSDFLTLMLKSLGGGGGAPGTAAEPWNPAAKLAGGAPMQPMKLPGAPAQPAPAPGAAPTDPMSKLMQSAMPQTMAGKGGASGG